MLLQLPFNVDHNLLHEAREFALNVDTRSTLNFPTGSFFYDPWEIKDEFRGSVWEEILNSLPFTLGEARIIILNHRECYSCHSDIDDRWHLNISAKNAYLINLDTEEMFESKSDGIWFEMNAGVKHTAINFGNRPRIQLVVRKLLNRSNRTDLISIKIKSKIKNLEDARYEFDNSISSFLNKVNKDCAMNNFTYSKDLVSLDIAPEYINKLLDIAENNFEVIVND